MQKLNKSSHVNSAEINDTLRSQSVHNPGAIFDETVSSHRAYTLSKCAK